MRKPVICSLAIAWGATALPQAFSNSGPSTGGTGPYAPANYTTDPALLSHTLYLPKTPTTKLPILIWGEGGCQANGLQFLSFLTQIASHGIAVIASGPPGGTGTTTAALLTAAIDWATSAAAAAKHPSLDPSRIAVAGQSCGGVEAYAVANDTRVSVVGIFNSGLMTPAESRRVVPGIKKPIFYFLGGSGDIAYENGERDFDLLPSGTPSWKGNLPVGHGGTYRDTDGGKFGVAAVRFLQWTLRGNLTAASFFTGQEAVQAGWAVEARNLDAITVTAI
ncbi:Alpha/Beta hydrolase protein [Lasiosphaeria hispida]|uniref:Alpha/Beta hydrolase protein n=1 Tax=Lasiosphaeria hispida TaxID=260671 RepID=A0AAJ0HL62_9PEZI|nr:Alpha/Beta hydrolase protein [Lasiosphaeria hispida]